MCICQSFIFSIFHPAISRSSQNCGYGLCHHLRIVDAQTGELDGSRRERHSHAVVLIGFDGFHACLQRVLSQMSVSPFSSRST